MEMHGKEPPHFHFQIRYFLICVFAFSCQSMALHPLCIQATDKDYVQQGAWPEFSRFVSLEQPVLTRSLPFSACDLNILFLEPNTL